LAHTVTSAVSSMNASSSSCTCHTPPSWGVTSSQAQSSSVGDRKRHWTNTAVPAVSSYQGRPPGSAGEAVTV
jgi:hypothetical protein